MSSGEKVAPCFVTQKPKRDQLNSKLKLASNDDWKKKSWNFFLGISVRENPDRTRLTLSSCADPLQFASLR